jgi:hypothetical protein
MMNRASPGIRSGIRDSMDEPDRLTAKSPGLLQGF